MSDFSKPPTPANETVRGSGPVPESILPNEHTPKQHRLNHNFLNPLVKIPDGFETDSRFFPAVIFDFDQKFMCIQRMGIDVPGDRARYVSFIHQDGENTLSLRNASSGKPLTFEEVAQQYVNTFIADVISMPGEYCVNPEAKAMVAADLLPYAATKVIYGKDRVAYVEVGILSGTPKQNQTNMVDRVAYVPIDMNGLPCNHEDSEDNPEFNEFLIRLERLLFGVFTVLLTRGRAIADRGGYVTKLSESELPEDHIHHVIRQLWSVHIEQGE